MADTVQAGKLFGSLRGYVERTVREQPYPSLALAAMVGYGAGGGLFSRWTRPLARAALGALLVPGFRERLRAVAVDAGRMGATGSA